MPLVTGIVELPDDLNAIVRGRLIVRVQWVGHSDAPATELGAFSLDAITEQQRRSRCVSFAMEVQQPDPGDCAILAHLDVDRDDVVSTGDYVTAEHIPVLAGHTPTPVRVTLARVGRYPSD